MIDGVYDKLGQLMERVERRILMQNGNGDHVEVRQWLAHPEVYSIRKHTVDGGYSNIYPQLKLKTSVLPRGPAYRWAPRLRAQSGCTIRNSEAGKPDATPIFKPIETITIDGVQVVRFAKLYSEGTLNMIPSLDCEVAGERNVPEEGEGYSAWEVQSIVVGPPDPAWFADAEAKEISPMDFYIAGTIFGNKALGLSQKTTNDMVSGIKNDRAMINRDINWKLEH
jgi:hypothetical protein